MIPVGKFGDKGSNFIVDNLTNEQMAPKLTNVLRKLPYDHSSGDRGRLCLSEAATASEAIILYIAVSEYIAFISPGMGHGSIANIMRNFAGNESSLSDLIKEMKANQ